MTGPARACGKEESRSGRGELTGDAGLSPPSWSTQEGSGSEREGSRVGGIHGACAGGRARGVGLGAPGLSWGPGSAEPGTGRGTRGTRGACRGAGRSPDTLVPGPGRGARRQGETSEAGKSRSGPRSAQTTSSRGRFLMLRDGSGDRASGDIFRQKEDFFLFFYVFFILLHFLPPNCDVTDVRHRMGSGHGAV